MISYKYGLQRQNHQGTSGIVTCSRGMLLYRTWRLLVPNSSVSLVESWCGDHVMVQWWSECYQKQKHELVEVGSSHIWPSLAAKELLFSISCTRIPSLVSIFQALNKGQCPQHAPTNFKLWSWCIWNIICVQMRERERDDDDAEELSCSDSNKSIIYVNDLLQSLLQHIVMWILGATKESYIF